MAADLQLAGTLVAPTGTGWLYTAFGQDFDSVKWALTDATYRQSVNFKRTQAKPSVGYAGNERLESKLVFEVLNADPKLVQMGIVNIVSSIPVAMTVANRTQMTNIMALLTQHATWLNSIKYGTVPT